MDTPLPEFTRICSFSLILSLFCIIFLSQATDKFRVALTGKYPPFSFYDSDGNLTGFDVDISKALASELGFDLEIVTIEWDGILAGLLAGKYEAIIGSMAITPQRQKKVSFSNPYYISGAQIFIHEKNTSSIKKIDNLLGLNVGVVLGETYEQFLRTKYPQINVITYKSTVDIFQDMKNKRLDAFFTDRLVGMYQIKKAGMPFVTAGDLLYQEEMGIPVSNPVILNNINNALSSIRSKGVLDSLRRYWFESKNSVSPQIMKINVIIKRLLKGFGITVGIAFISFFIGILSAIPCGVVLNGRCCR